MSTDAVQNIRTCTCIFELTKGLEVQLQSTGYSISSFNTLALKQIRTENSEIGGLILRRKHGKLEVHTNLSISAENKRVYTKMKKNIRFFLYVYVFLNFIFNFF